MRCEDCGRQCDPPHPGAGSVGICPACAEKALDKAETAPLSKEEVDAIVGRVIARAQRGEEG